MTESIFTDCTFIHTRGDVSDVTLTGGQFLIAADGNLLAADGRLIADGPLGQITITGETTIVGAHGPTTTIVRMGGAQEV